MFESKNNNKVENKNVYFIDVKFINNSFYTITHIYKFWNYE